ncbi:DUF2624 domain-containing protein [Bacillus chungangensis]|uniref:Thiamine pyrophosphate-dependent acetolactate synthase large subunit-like protein n=1 Tax=Bacillus chungangensis TaxID=587633 RepID=A0ABT9WPK0_9BACI|nr:DUF2624 domain-containing protein [Bacillus chungangensis]MDQ0175208.1 thiamine pyrophosphate-dependent acetolactate synthase large subunit-like protein [Bacillus chungangensis]
MKLVQNMVNYKMNMITADELLKYAKQFNVALKQEDAEKIAAHIRGKNINIFDHQERAALIKDVAKIAGPHIAKEINRIIVQFST